MSHTAELPEELTFPNSRSYLIYRWVTHLIVVVLIGGFTLMFAFAGQWVGALLWAPLLVLVLTSWWVALTERLVLRRNGFDYRLGRKQWTCDWSATAGFVYGGSYWSGRWFVRIRWLDIGPEFVILGVRTGKEAELFSTFGLKSSKLADLMNRYRARALGTAR